MMKNQVSVSSTVTTDKKRTTVYQEQEIFGLMRTWRSRRSLDRDNNDSRAIADAASVFFKIGEDRMNKLIRLQRAGKAQDPIEHANELLCRAIDDLEED